MPEEEEQLHAAFAAAEQTNARLFDELQQSFAVNHDLIVGYGNINLVNCPPASFCTEHGKMQLMSGRDIQHSDTPSIPKTT